VCELSAVFADSLLSLLLNLLHVNCLHLHLLRLNLLHLDVLHLDLLPVGRRCSSWAAFLASYLIIRGFAHLAGLGLVSVMLYSVIVKAADLVGITGMHKTGCSGETRLLLHAPSSSEAGMRNY